MSDPNQPDQPNPYQPPEPGAAPPPPPPPPPPAQPTYNAPPAYGQPQYGQAQYGPPGYAGAAPQNGAGTTSLVLAIIGLLCCGILSIIAVVMGSKGKKLAAQGLATNGGVAQAGFVIGWIGIALWVLGLIVNGVLLATNNGSFSYNIGT